MGVHAHRGTMPGALTPICEECGVSLCWDIGAGEYAEAAGFWDAWTCRDCNGGIARSLAAWRAARSGTGEGAAAVGVRLAVDADGGRLD